MNGRGILSHLSRRQRLFRLFLYSSHLLANLLDTHSLADGIDENVLGVTTDMPHREACEIVVVDELSFGG